MLDAAKSPICANMLSINDIIIIYIYDIFAWKYVLQIIV